MSYEGNKNLCKYTIVDSLFFFHFWIKLLVSIPQTGTILGKTCLLLVTICCATNGIGLIWLCLLAHAPSLSFPMFACVIGMGIVLQTPTGHTRCLLSIATINLRIYILFPSLRLDDHVCRGKIDTDALSLRM